MNFFEQTLSIIRFAQERYGNLANISISEDSFRKEQFILSVGSNGYYMSWSAGSLEELWTKVVNEISSTKELNANQNLT